MKAKYFIGTAIILVFLIWGATAFFRTAVRYVSFAEARTATKTVQIAGRIDTGSIIYGTDKRRLEFVIYDIKSNNPDSADKLKIIYEGVVPANFDQATSVLVRGKPGEGGFVAEKLLIKCPSKYQGLIKDSQG
jgi:cytochrome c-type biogenesis protein CcmE